MSSKRNHSKRSHRSEHIKRSSIGSSSHKMRIKQATKPKRMGLFERFKNLFRRNTSNG